jgi:hypothetical protein
VEEPADTAVKVVMGPILQVSTTVKLHTTTAGMPQKQKLEPGEVVAEEELPLDIIVLVYITVRKAQPAVAAVSIYLVKAPTAQKVFKLALAAKAVAALAELVAVKVDRTQLLVRVEEVPRVFLQDLSDNLIPGAEIIVIIYPPILLVVDGAVVPVMDTMPAVAAVVVATVEVAALVLVDLLQVLGAD